LQPFGFEDLDGFIDSLSLVCDGAAGEQHNGEYGGDSCLNVRGNRNSLTSETAIAGDTANLPGA
jgi:hypothetical protein